MCKPAMRFWQLITSNISFTLIFSDFPLAMKCRCEYSSIFILCELEWDLGFFVKQIQISWPEWKAIAGMKQPIWLSVRPICIWT